MTRNPDWLYNEDIGGLDCPGVTLTVRGVEEVPMPNGVEKLGIRFRYSRPTSTPGRKIREDKVLVLNAGNTRAMQDIHGSVPEQWVGRKVELYVVPDTGHGFGPGIRIRAQQQCRTCGKAPAMLTGDTDHPWHWLCTGCAEQIQNY